MEFAAHVQDFLDQDLERLYPTLVGIPSITIVHSDDHILSTYDKRISEYAEVRRQRATARNMQEAVPNFDCNVNKFSEQDAFQVM